MRSGNSRRKTSADRMRELSTNRVVVIVLVAVLGILILLTVLGFNFIGDGLRDAFDPKMKR